jgi:hypothetical protein
LPTRAEHDKVENMEVTLRIPDDIAGRMTEAGEDLQQKALEGLALEEYRNGHITDPELRRLLGFRTRHELDGFLKSHEIYAEYTMEDLDREREDLRRLGF